MKLANFNYAVQHVAGKRFFTLDALSRKPLMGAEQEKDILQVKDMEGFIN